MTREDLILDRYEPLGTAGEGGFGTVQIAWDPRIQRKVAIKTIRLTALDAARAALPGAQAVSSSSGSSGSAPSSTAERWRGVEPWADLLEKDLADDRPFEGEAAGGWLGPDDPYADFDEQGEFDYFDVGFDEELYADGGMLDDSVEGEASESAGAQVTALSHLPGLDEARTAAMLVDQRIVTVYDFEVRGRTAYLIMEYVEGITLSNLLDDYADYLTLDMVAAVFDSVAGALMVAHEAGVLHLDIKPDNILINAQGQVKVTDFGLATLADASGAGKTGGGTIGYMPPEQIRRERLDARTDEWSLASVSYEMLTGSNPFRVQGLEEAEAAISDAELVLPSLCWQDADEQIDDVIFFALDPDRDERYASVADFVEEADKFLGDAEKGAAQLQLVVEDALGLVDEEEPAPEVDDIVALQADGPIVPRRSFTQRFKDLVASWDEAEEQADQQDWDEAEQESIDDAGSTERMPRERLKERIPDGALFVGSRAFGAVASGMLSILALANMQPLMVALGPGAVYVVAVIAAIVAAAGAIRSHIGALIAFCLLGIAVVMCGHPIVGAIVLVITVAWWYTIGHEGSASANIALLGPVAGALGGTALVPFFAGFTLRPLQAVFTTLFAAAIAVVMGGFGTMSLLDWGAFSFWDFGRSDISHAILRMLGQPATWVVIASWIAASLVLSLLKLRESKALAIIGIALAVVIVLVGFLAFSAPTPQIIISVIIGAAILLAAV